MVSSQQKKAGLILVAVGWFLVFVLTLYPTPEDAVIAAATSMTADLRPGADPGMNAPRSWRMLAIFSCPPVSIVVARFASPSSAAGPGSHLQDAGATLPRHELALAWRGANP